jgi:hypothetical protein
MENFGMFEGHLVYCVVIWYMFWPFGVFCGRVVYVFSFWYIEQRKIWQPCSFPWQKMTRKKFKNLVCLVPINF